MHYRVDKNDDGRITEVEVKEVTVCNYFYFIHSFFFFNTSISLQVIYRISFGQIIGLNLIFDEQSVIFR